MKKNNELAKLRGERLKSALEHFKMKSVDITKNGRRTESQVSDWINGKVTPSEPSLKDIIDEYLPTVRLEYLLGYDEYMTMRELEKEYSTKNDSYNNSSLTVLESALRAVCIRENIEVPILDNVPELLLLQAQLKDYACSLMWQYIAHRENSEVWSYLDNMNK